MFFFIAFDDNTEQLKNNGASAQAIQAYKSAKEYKVQSPYVVVVLQLRTNLVYLLALTPPLHGPQVQEDQQ